jgi:hypothetical protein
LPHFYPSTRLVAPTTPLPPPPLIRSPFVTRQPPLCFPSSTPASQLRCQIEGCILQNVSSQQPPPPMKGSHRSEMILSDENLVWTEQHHRNTSHKSMHNLSQGHLSSAFDLAPSGDESDSAEKHRRSQFYTPDPQKRTKEYHIEQATQAIQLLKAASKPTGWKKVLKHKSGCLVYQSTNSSDKHPAFKGEHVLRGYRAQDVFSVVGVRKLWE